MRQDWQHIGNCWSCVMVDGSSLYNSLLFCSCLIYSKIKSFLKNSRRPTLSGGKGLVVLGAVSEPHRKQELTHTHTHTGARVRAHPCMHPLCLQAAAVAASPTAAPGKVTEDSAVIWLSGRHLQSVPSHLLCGWQGLGAPARCQAWASEVGEPSSGHWSIRDLLAPHNIKWQKLSERSPAQRKEPAPLNDQQATLHDTLCQQLARQECNPTH